MKKLLLSLLAVVASCVYASADTSTLTLSSGNLSGLNTTDSKTVTAPNGFKWTFSMTGKGSLGSFDNSYNRGYQFGSSNNPISTLTIASEGFKDYTITKVTLHSCMASSGNATVSVAVGESAFLSNGNSSVAVPISTSGTSDVVFEGVASGEIKVEYNVKAKALYVIGIDVEYTKASVKKQAHLSFPQNDYYVSVAKTASFEAPELDNPYNVEPITYSIDVDDEDIAIIDENTGDIVLGTTVADITVTASFAGNDEYEADDQTYVIHITEDEFATVTFDFENNDYGMTRFSGGGAGYNAPNTKFGNEWVICTANEKTRLWWTGKEATEVASGKSMRVYSGGEIKIETPAGTEITNISIFHYNENGDAEDVTDAEDHEHVASIEGNTAVLSADWTSSFHRLSAVEITYKGKTEVFNAVVDAFKAGKHDNGDSHFTVKVNGVEQVSHSISFESSSEEPTQVEFSHYYPHATIYAKFEPSTTPAAAHGVYYDAAEGFTEHTAPITLTGSGLLSYYAEMNGHTTPVQTVSVTDNTTSISEISSMTDKAEVYDLQGRRVLTPARGLYIIGGKLQLK